MARTRRDSARYTASTVSRAGLAAGLVSQCSTKSRSGALFTPADQRTPEQAARVALDDALIAQVQAADVGVLGVPMYNFGVPAQLKNWIDAISRAGVTFRYTANGPEGLLKGKKVHVAPPAAVSTGIRRRIRRCLT